MKAIMRAVYSLMLLIALPFGLQAQSVEETLRLYFIGVNPVKANAVPTKVTGPENSAATLLSITRYLEDPSSLVRSKAYELIQLAGLNAKEFPVRQDAASKLIGGIKDPHSGNAGQAICYLTEFNIADFDPAARDTLLNIFKRESPHYDDLIKLLGYLQLTQARDGLRAIAQDAKSPGTERWATLVALARMGDSYATNDIIARVRRFPVNDNVVYQIFPDLVYTRQRPVFEILIQALNSDAKNCQSANGENITKIPCAYRIMEMIAPAIEGYPYKLDESGDIDAANYEEALITVREWFKTNPDYAILTDRY